MKSLLLTVLSVIFIVPTSSAQMDSSHNNSDNKDYVLVLSVPFNLETPARVACDNFATTFKKLLHAHVLSNADSLRFFLSFINKSKYVKKNKEFDVKCKLIFYLKNVETFVVCTNGRDVLINGREIKKNDKFTNFLRGMIPG